MTRALGLLAAFTAGFVLGVWAMAEDAVWDYRPWEGE